MAKQVEIAMIIPVLLVLSLVVHSGALMGEGVEGPVAPAPVHVVVEGMVYYQRCDGSSMPIGKAVTSVVCIDDVTQEVMYRKSFETNGIGYLYAELKGFNMRPSLLNHPLHSCNVRLVSSPRKDCNIRTNLNNGIDGAPLRNEGKSIVKPNYKASCCLYCWSFGFPPQQLCSYEDDEGGSTN